MKSVKNGLIYHENHGFGVLKQLVSPKNETQNLDFTPKMGQKWPKNATKMQKMAQNWKKSIF